MLISPQRILTPEKVQVSIYLCPAYNALLSMIALLNPDNYGGVDNWAKDTVHQMGEDLHQQHRFLLGAAGLDGLTNVVRSAEGLASFEGFLAELSGLEAVDLRDQLLYWMFNAPHIRVSAEHIHVQLDSTDHLLEDFGLFESHLREVFMTKMDSADLRPVFDIYQDPARLQQTLVGHLRLMWDRFLAEEWGRILPRLEQSVSAFQALTLPDCTMLEAIDLVTGRDLRFAFQIEELLKYRVVHFIPHIHNGPYVVWFGNNEEIRISFPARIPATTVQNRTTFDETSLANRYKALGDEIRLRILRFVQQAEEVSTQEIIDFFDLDKSAASRHLRQLVATNLLIQRREEGAKKVYRLNPAALEETIQMLQSLK